MQRSPTSKYSRRTVLGLVTAFGLTGCSSLTEDDDDEVEVGITTGVDDGSETGSDATTDSPSTGGTEGADGTTTRSTTQDETDSVSVEGTVEGLDVQLDRTDGTVMLVQFEFTVDGSSDVEPLLTVTDDRGTELYSETQIDDRPPEIEMPIDHVQAGVTYTIELFYEEKTIDSTQVTYDGFDVALRDSNVDGLTVQQYTDSLEKNPEVTLQNIGDLPVRVDDVSLLIGPTEVDGFVIGSEPFPVGATKEFSTATTEDFTPGEYEMTARVHWNDRTLGEDSTTIMLEKPENTELRKFVKSQVERLEPLEEDGAPKDGVIGTVVGAGFDRKQVDEAIEQLKRDAEIYEPAANILRSV